MPATWKHRDLGAFRYESGAWTQTINAPGFKAFAYDTGRGKIRKPTGKYKLAIEARDEKEKPSPDQIAVVTSILADQPRVVELITNALWNDFAGKPPHSGMWWHGQLQKIKKLEEMPTLKSASDLGAILQLDSISVRKPDPGRTDEFIINPFTRQKVKAPPRPALPAVAEFDFHAPFEEEHGVGILTDGKAVFGLGYIIDVEPYRVD